MGGGRKARESRAPGVRGLGMPGHPRAFRVLLSIELQVQNTVCVLHVWGLNASPAA